MFPVWQYVAIEDYFTLNNAYYLFVGIPVSEWNQTSDYITTDGTCEVVNWSVSSLTASNKTVYLDHSQAHDFVGVVSYFETYTQAGEGEGQSFALTPGNFGVILNNYGESIGIPFFALIIAIILIVVFIAVPYRFASEHNISLPNYAYLICITGGVILCFALGLLEMWMFIMFIIILLGITFNAFKEPIMKFAGIFKRPLAEEEIKMEKHMEQYFSKNIRAYLKDGKMQVRNDSIKRDKGVRMPKKWVSKGKGSGYSAKSGYPTASQEHQDWLKRRGKRT
jgi:hypothetical protein